MRIAFLRILLASLAALHVSGCNRAALSPLSHEMYVWQLAWTPAVTSALERTAPSMARVHVLALEIDPLGEVHEPALDAEALRKLAALVIPVVRIDGRAQDLPRARAHIGTMLESWKRQQLPLSALEIDFDCGTSQLDAYARFLRGLRSQMPAGTRLAITALPAWMSSPQLPALARVADEVVLQVHSVRNPVNGLFDAEEALGWIDAYSRLSVTPFRVALPTYGSRVRWADGRVVSVESETSPVLSRGVSRELAADPEAMAGFVRELSARRVRGLAGIVWFRMPTDADRRAWSVPTFLAVIQSKPFHRSIRATFVPRGGGSGDIVITNTGSLDAPVPKEIRLDASCRDADAVSGYVLDRRDRSLRWQRTSAKMMRSGAALNVGWANCSDSGAPLEISY